MTVLTLLAGLALIAGMLLVAGAAVVPILLARDCERPEPRAAPTPLPARPPARAAHASVAA